MRVKVLFICLLFSCWACAQVSEGIEKNQVYQGFSGGMMLHTGGSLFIVNTYISIFLGIFAFSSFWSIGEVFKQRERVRKGWFPMNPKRKNEY